MSIARQIADLLEASGDVKSDHLDNVPPSDWNTLLNVPAHANTDTRDAANITTGVIPSARLGSSTANSSTYLRGDGQWVANCTNHSNCSLNGSTYSNCTTNGNGKTNCNNTSSNCNNHGNCGNCNFSDERLKVNIQFLGLKGDLKIYAWNYKWDLTRRYNGVIAQELINTKYENALCKSKDGYYMVDYNLLPI